MKYPPCVLSVLTASLCVVKYSDAFVPSFSTVTKTQSLRCGETVTPSHWGSNNAVAFLSSSTSRLPWPSLGRQDGRRPGGRRTTTRQYMSAEDFSEASYTEAAWAAIAALPRVADYYSATTVEAPMLMDTLLNPSKHSAGDNAEAAKVVIEKVLTKAGVNIMELRQQLENYMAKQPRITSGGAEQQKSMGRSLQNVLVAARKNKAILNVSETPYNLRF